MSLPAPDSGLAQLLPHLESLGDNCEFGFVLRKLQHNGGGLFRWSITTVDGLLRFLSQPESVIYRFEDLVPYSQKMVKDLQSGFCFHSAMGSSKVEGEQRFDLSEDVRRALYLQESEKIWHLREKLIARLRTGGVFVVKRNLNLSDDEIFSLAEIVQRHNSGNILLAIRSTGDSSLVSKVSILAPGVVLGHLSRFAPYVKADDICYEEWSDLLSNTYQVLFYGN